MKFDLKTVLLDCLLFGLSGRIFLVTTLLIASYANSQNVRLLAGRSISANEIQSYLTKFDQVNDCIYVLDNEFTTFGLHPSIIYTDLRSFPKLANITSTANLVRIKISDADELEQFIDFNSIKNLTSVVAVLILCEREISDTSLVSAIKNIPPNCSVLTITSKSN